MKNYIKLEGRKKIEISEETARNLKEQFADKPKRWRAEQNKDYWYVTDWGEVARESEQPEGHRANIYQFNTGNYFKTEKEAEEQAKKLQALATVKGYILDRNCEENWVAVWSSEQVKAEICFHYTDNKWKIWTESTKHKFPLLIPHTSEKIAQEVLDKFQDELDLIRELL